MSVTNAPTLDQALALARRLSLRDRARLIAHIAEELAEATLPTTAVPADFALPVLTGGAWVDDLPLSRKDLYDDDERC
jgi:hypothetical protein